MARGLFRDDFIYGGAAFGTSASSSTPWRATETGSSTVWTAGIDNGSSGDAAGIARIGLEATNEVQNVCLSFGDVLQFNIASNLIWKGRFRLGQSALDTTTSVCFGLAGDRNDTINSIAIRAMFKLVGSVSTTIVYCVTDDGTTDSGDISTGVALTTGWKDFEIRMPSSSVITFHMTDTNNRLARVVPGTSFSMAAYAGSLQPYMQIQKTADTNADYLDSDFVELTWDR